MQLVGRWIDRTSLYEVERRESRRKKKVTRQWLTIKAFNACERKVMLPLSPLPCLDDMSPEERRSIAHELCGSILPGPARVEKAPLRSSEVHLPARFDQRGIVPEVHADSKETWRPWKKGMGQY